MCFIRVVFNRVSYNKNQTITGTYQLDYSANCGNCLSFNTQLKLLYNVCFRLLISYILLFNREGDYDEFLCHLQGLCDLYQLSRDT